MQVNVFITRQDGALQNSLLVLRVSPIAAIPKEYREGWRYFATTNTDDRMLGDDATALEAEIASGICRGASGGEGQAIELAGRRLSLAGIGKEKPALQDGLLVQ